MEAHINRGYAYHASGNYDLAIKDFSEAIRISPKGALGYSNRGNSYWKKGDFAHAIADLNEAVSLNSRDPQVYHNRGTIYGGHGDHEKAAESRLASCNNPQRLKVVPFQDSRDFLLLLGTRNSLLI